jgi:hypothetical protein
MSTKLGFAILSYDNPDQLLRLVTTLTRIFDGPPIACHHDFTRSTLNVDRFPKNVKFVRPHINTSWADISCVLAALEALGNLRSRGPDWFVLLSGSDYPVRNSDEIVAELRETQFDVLMDHREINFDTARTSTEVHGFCRSEWAQIAHDRYCTAHYWLPYPSRALFRSGLFPFWKRRFPIRNEKISRLLTGFRDRVYGGDFWFQANHKAIDRLLTAQLDRFTRYFRDREFPEEAFFQTVLCNEPDLKITPQHRRYADWTRGGPHPKWLEVADVDEIVATQAYFARKFPPSGTVADYVDKRVLGL